MTQPAMLVLDDEPAALDQLEWTLDRRYGQEYVVVGEGSTTAGLERLARLAADDRPVAIVCVAAAMLDTGGSEFLAMARRLNPSAKRVLIVPRGGPSAPSLRVRALLLQDQLVAQPVLRAKTLGVVDTYLASPHGGRDEGFHLAVSELLEEWARDSAADQPAVQIIGQQHSARAHELRDALTRNGIPIEFSPVESDRARTLLDESGHTGSKLPVVITYTGRALADPTNDELGAAFVLHPAGPDGRRGHRGRGSRRPIRCGLPVIRRAVHALARA